MHQWLNRSEGNDPLVILITIKRHPTQQPFPALAVVKHKRDDDDDDADDGSLCRHKPIHTARNISVMPKIAVQEFHILA